MSQTIGERELGEQICEVGRRLYARGYVSGNDGNISYLLDDARVLCTPTLISKGYMTPDDLCVVNRAGEQVAGARPRTSEIFLHLEIYRGDPAVRAVVHSHPPFATAFAVAGEPIPTGVLPEGEVFLGVVPLTPYETPGNQRFAETIRPFVGKACAAVLGNHGAVTWGPTLERALWYTEILDSYCRILLLAKLVGSVQRLPEGKVRELLALRAAFGMPPDPRLQGGDVFVNPQFGR